MDMVSNLEFFIKYGLLKEAPLKLKEFKNMINISEFKIKNMFDVHINTGSLMDSVVVKDIINE